MITDFTPLAGDRCFGEDQAMIGGLGRFKSQSVVIMGQEKGNDTESRIRHNFGMAKPEGYRKAIRLMEMASQFQLPVLSLVDTAGAYPGVEAEARGQASHCPVNRLMSASAYPDDLGGHWRRRIRRRHCYCNR